MTEPSATVYSWYMPEVAKVVGDLAHFDYPTETFRQNYTPGLDTLHEPLMQDYLDLSLTAVFSDRSFAKWEEYLPYNYYTNGSSEALFHLIARHQTYYPNVPLYQFVGEYQGYNEYAKAVGTEFNNVEFGQDIDALPPGVFFISAPSSVDGNIVQQSVINRICNKHYVVIDCAYAGMAHYPDKHQLKLNDRVAAVVGSMSKPFGLYYHRIGFVWSRDPIMSLYGNKWFKNAFSIAVGRAVYDQWIPDGLANQYRSWQKRACLEASVLLEAKVKPSDVWLLGHILPGTDVPESPALEKFRRGPGYRFCLTPYYMKYEEQR